MNAKKLQHDDFPEVQAAIYGVALSLDSFLLVVDLPAFPIVFLDHGIGFRRTSELHTAGVPGQLLPGAEGHDPQQDQLGEPVLYSKLALAGVPPLQAFSQSR